MKKNKNLLGAIVFVCMVVLSCLPCFAATKVEDDISLMYVNVGNKGATINISNGTATCKATMTAKKSTSLKITMILQKKSGTAWINVETWTASKTGTSVSMVKTKAISTNSSYRIKVTFVAGGETLNQIVYP